MHCCIQIVVWGTRSFTGGVKRGTTVLHYRWSWSRCCALHDKQPQVKAGNDINSVTVFNNYDCNNCHSLIIIIYDVYAKNTSLGMFQPNMGNQVADSSHMRISFDEYVIPFYTHNSLSTMQNVICTTSLLYLVSMNQWSWDWTSIVLWMTNNIRWRQERPYWSLFNNDSNNCHI